MKKSLFILATAFIGFTAWAQENIISVSAGYAFVTGQEVYADLTGWRINGVYEFNMMEGAISHGIGFGYAGVAGVNTRPGEFYNRSIEIGTWPIYYQPKYIFGNEKIKGFVKGVLGWQFSNFAIGSLKASDSGFYGGGGGGLMFNLSENIFINAEYEIAWMSNYYYRDGWLNSALGGIGLRF